MADLMDDKKQKSGYDELKGKGLLSEDAVFAGFCHLLKSL